MGFDPSEPRDDQGMWTATGAIVLGDKIAYHKQQAQANGMNAVAAQHATIAAKLERLQFSEHTFHPEVTRYGTTTVDTSKTNHVFAVFSPDHSKGAAEVSETKAFQTKITPPAGLNKSNLVGYVLVEHGQNSSAGTFVHPDFQRLGIATALYKGYAARHGALAPAGHLTADGAAFRAKIK